MKIYTVEKHSRPECFVICATNDLDVAKKVANDRHQKEVSEIEALCTNEDGSFDDDSYDLINSKSYIINEWITPTKTKHILTVGCDKQDDIVLRKRKAVSE